MIQPGEGIAIADRGPGTFTRIHAGLRRTRLGAIARKLGIGRALLIVFHIGLPAYLRFLYSRTVHLPAIAKARPMHGGDESFEVHMLLNHERIYEGAWALYSFRHFSGPRGHIVIHDDGTLQEADLALLRSLFGPITIWRREEADAVCSSRLKQLGLERLDRLRKQLVLALKLTDPVLLGSTRSVVIMDSDVLFYKRPTALLDAALAADPAYSVCCCYCYSMPESDMKALIGEAPIPLFNPGVFAVDRSLIDLERWNEYLRDLHFWNPDGSGQVFAELTLWACEMTRLNAKPLPPTYAICPPSPADYDFGHYCGGGSAHSILFYTRGLPYLRRQVMP
jgi:hypothetical protein